MNEGGPGPLEAVSVQVANGLRSEAGTMTEGVLTLDFKSHMEGNKADVAVQQDGIEWTRQGDNVRLIGCWTAFGMTRRLLTRLGAGRRVLMAALIPILGLFAVLALSSPAAAWPTTTTTVPPTTTTTTVPPTTTTTVPPTTTTTTVPPTTTTTTTVPVVAPSVTSPTVPPSTSPAVATTPQIAFTGAPVGAEAAVGVGLLGAGSALVLAARRRRARP